MPPYERTRGFTLRSVQSSRLNWMTHIVQQITSLNSKVYQFEIAQVKSIMVEESQAGKSQRSNATDFRIPSIEISGTRTSARADVRITLPSEKVLNTMSWQNLSYWKVNSRWQCKAEENEKFATSSVAERFDSAQKRKHPAGICETWMNAWVQTEISWNGWHKLCSGLDLWNQKFIKLKSSKLQAKLSPNLRQDVRGV